MKNIENDLVLRSSTPGYEHREWRVVQTGWDYKGQAVVVQNNTTAMDNKPSRIVVEYLIKMDVDNKYIYPSTRAVKQLLLSKETQEIEVEGIKKPVKEWLGFNIMLDDSVKSLSEWRENKEVAMALLDKLSDWEN